MAFILFFVYLMGTWLCRHAKHCLKFHIIFFMSGGGVDKHVLLRCENTIGVGWQ